eukprot:gene1516-1539_t
MVTIRPRSIVELGTHAGVSYAAMCHAVQRGGFACTCTAIDSWAGDDHSGAYGGDVLAELEAFNTAHFGAFSRLLRANFDDAVTRFADGSIDLLHIDGFHTYEAVRHDFETWRPKLSERAVVLFHDTQVRVRNFGVWKYWEEIRNTFAGHLEFSHAFGLGVLMVGAQAPAALLQLGTAPAHTVQARFAALGERHTLVYQRVRDAETEVAPAEKLPPAIDAALDCGTIHIAERFAAPPGLHAVALPRDAVTRNEGGSTVWIASADGRDWRMGTVVNPPASDAVTLVFAAFAHPRIQHFHLFVTDPCDPGAGLPRRLADLLGHRRAPIGVDTPRLELPNLPQHGLFLFSEPVGNTPVVILVRPQLADNIGAVARAMANGGLFHLRLVAPRDGWPQERAWRMASGADRLLDAATVHPTVADAVADLHHVYATCPRPRHIVKPVLTARGAAAEIRVVTARDLRVGLLFGPERAGLDNDDMACADALVRFPLDPQFMSLNLAQAVLVMAYEWWTAQDETLSRTLMTNETRIATKGELENFLGHLTHELDECGFLKNLPKRPGMVRNIRHFFQRGEVTEQELRTLHGIVTELALGRRLRGRVETAPSTEGPGVK